MKECLFCNIGKGVVNSFTLYEDDILKVFLDINPSSLGHTLIIPKDHYLDIDDIPLEVLFHIMKICKNIKKLIEEKLKPEGFCLIQNNGFIQEVKHYHLHLIPKYKNGFKKLSVSEVYNILGGNNERNL